MATAKKKTETKSKGSGKSKGSSSKGNGCMGRLLIFLIILTGILASAYFIYPDQSKKTWNKGVKWVSTLSFEEETPINEPQTKRSSGKKNPAAGAGSDKKKQNKTVAFRADTTVNKKFALQNPLSIRRYCKDYKKLKAQNDLREIYTVAFVNSDKSQYLLGYTYEDDKEFNFVCFEIGYLANQKISRWKRLKLDDRQFATESGICLGMTLAQMQLLKGSGTLVKEKDETLLTYRIGDFSNSAFLQKYNLPAYFMKCRFKDDKLVRIVYGFECP